ncbi:MAG: MFS transporter, partial [Pseudomonadota bacterium]
MTASHQKATVRVLSGQYFVYFAVLGLYLPFFNLWLHRLGFSGERIGAVSGVRSTAVVVMPLLWALAADRFKNRRALFVAANLLAASLFAAYLFTQSFWPILAITAVWAVFYAPIVSFMEAFAMEILGPERNQYGRVRVWGSASFIAVVLLAGWGVAAWGVWFILPAILA